MAPVWQLAWVPVLELEYVAVSLVVVCLAGPAWLA